MTKTSKIILGIFGAAAAGVVIGLLIAPERGTDMRKRIKRTAGEWADNLTHLFSESKEAAEEAVNEAKDKTRQAKAAAEEKVNILKDSLS